MKKIYNKLVRDNIPEIIAAEGKSAKIRVLGQKEYRRALVEKIHEEADELTQHFGPKELADIQEIVLALREELGLSSAEFDKIREDKAQKRGAFKKRIFLESVDR